MFDTRFASARIRKKISGLLGRELGFPSTLTVDLRTITDYLALVVWAYSLLADELRDRVPARVFDMIVHADNRAKVSGLEAWVRVS